MSNYTYSVGEIIRDYAISYGKENNLPIPIDLEGQLDLARRGIFNFHYEIFDESYREIFEKNFLRYFHEYEIGQETVARFMVYLRQFMMTEFPKFNSAYKFQKEQAEYLFYKNFQKTMEDDKGNVDTTGNIKSKEDTSSDDKIHTDTNKLNTLSGSIDDTQSGGTTVTGTTDTTGNSTTKNTGTTKVEGSEENTEKVDGVSYVQTSEVVDTNSNGKSNQTQTDNTTSSDDTTGHVQSKNETDLNTKSSRSYKDFKDNTDGTIDTTVGKKGNKTGDVDSVGNSKHDNHKEILSYGWSDTPWESIMKYSTNFTTIDEMVFNSAINYNLFMLIW